MRVLELKLARAVARVIAAPMIVFLLTGSSDCDDDWRHAPPPDHGQKWIGGYDGAADVFWCYAGTNEEGLAAFMDIRRIEGNQVMVALTIARGSDHLFGADAMLTASGSPRLVGRRQYGNSIDEFSLSLYANAITGTLRKLKQTTRGMEYCTTETTLNVRRTSKPSE